MVITPARLLFSRFGSDAQARKVVTSLACYATVAGVPSP